MVDNKNSEKTMIIDEHIDDALSSRYLAYALSTITQRALPDVRDGLKPVHRRILYAMRQLKLNPENAYKKSARIVGDVMGQYHPHGDASIYDALVKLSQSFSTRYPLVDGQGNFGNIDGDSPAAMRYTEAKMTSAGVALLDGLDENSVDFSSTYNEEDEEPDVLPAGFPNLLANGSHGIAVGMATSIPPHNASEICSAALHLIKTPNARVSTLMEYIKGPDLPTGGVIVETKESMLETYKTGKGGFKVRSKWSTEDLGRGMYQIVVTEIPYQVQKSRLIEKLAEVIETKKAPWLEDVRDESTEDVRIILEPKSKNIDPNLLMESLFKVTELESRTSLNMNVLDATRTPRVMDLKEVIQSYLDHLREVLLRRSRQRLKKINDRLEVLDGYMKAFLNLDEVIRIIRYEDKPKAELINVFQLTDRQADAILNMRLRALNKLQEIEISNENNLLISEKETIETLLSSPDAQWSRISDQVKAIKSEYNLKTVLGARRTSFASLPEIKVDLSRAFIQKEPITVVMSEKGWIRALKGHSHDVSAIKYKDEDKEGFVLTCVTTDKLIVFASNGKFYTIGADKLPGGRGNGDPIRLLIDLENDHEPVGMFVHNPDRNLLVASSEGYGFKVKESDVIASTKGGRKTLNVKGDSEAIRCVEIVGGKIATIGENRKILVFNIDELPEMTRGKGVRLQKFKDGGLADLTTFKDIEGLSFIDSAGRTNAVADWKVLQGKRAGAGRLAPRGFSRQGLFSPDKRLF
ncbi:MAG: DNA topoisomerase IV subunit A [Hellea sp.]|nr:DNA topoisomerase IV subunit A [Hellea sp.]MDG1522406.1 DNA topoisomerase IV subunit A [Hellea sp.]MDG1666230.1 DNA topoisomerase IV subunit A [Hellea sp.]MDG2361092.1 DNA topoisomerase IV subunit A [Hellea sp.]|tara:strand:- start:2856 stop:5105 length:2250 start_codon:yes stop_codon:yes gene_type:complete